MRLIDDDHFVFIEVSIVLSFSQKDTVRHQFDLGLFTDLIVKPDLITNSRAQLGLQLIGNATGDGARS